MEERRRQAYLQAIGIPYWEGRHAAPPVNAEPLPRPAEEIVTSPSPVPPSVPEAAGDPIWGDDLPPLSAYDTQDWSGDEGNDEGGDEWDIPQPARSDLAGLDWDGLAARVSECRACELHRSRTNTVFGVGDRQADLLIIGEAPGADEDRQGEPFVGRAGQLLNSMLRSVGLRRERVYIANVLKCRPPGNRNPSLEEVVACSGFLNRQIQLIQPKVILSLGGVSAQNLLKTDESVGRLRRRVHRYGAEGLPLLVTYHPAYLLRRPEEKAKSWQDLQQVMELLT